MFYYDRIDMMNDLGSEAQMGNGSVGSILLRDLPVQVFCTLKISLLLRRAVAAAMNSKVFGMFKT